MVLFSLLLPSDRPYWLLNTWGRSKDLRKASIQDHKNKYKNSKQHSMTSTTSQEDQVEEMLWQVWTTCRPPPMGDKPHNSKRGNSGAYILPDDGRRISRNVAEKHYDSMCDKSRKQYEYNWINSPNIFEKATVFGQKLLVWLFMVPYLWFWKVTKFHFIIFSHLVASYKKPRAPQSD